MSLGLRREGFPRESTHNLEFEEFVVREQWINRWVGTHLVQKRKKSICEQDLKHFCLPLATAKWRSEFGERGRGHRNHEELT